MVDRTEQIEAELAAATAGGIESQDNAVLRGHAPEHLRWLLDENARCRESLEYIERQQDIFRRKTAREILTGYGKNQPIQKADFAYAAARDAATEALQLFDHGPAFSGGRSDVYQQIRILLTMAQRLSDMARGQMPRLLSDCPDHTVFNTLYQAEDAMQSVVNELKEVERSRELDQCETVRQGQATRSG
jgi:hypothetical protein